MQYKNETNKKRKGHLAYIRGWGRVKHEYNRLPTTETV